MGFDGDYAEYRVAQDDLLINTFKVMEIINWMPLFTRRSSIRPP